VTGEGVVVAQPVPFSHERHVGALGLDCRYCHASVERSAFAGSMASSRLELSRAPNSEYWWLACGVDDTGCQSEGRQWVRSLNQQTATIDPQDRTRARLARSY
jgi:hypothetical protein